MKRIMDLSNYIETEEIEDRYGDLLEEAEDALEDLGIRLAPQPIDEDGVIDKPTLPANLGELHSSVILDLLGQFSAYSEYVKGQLAKVKVECATSERRVKDTKAQIRAKLTGSSTKIADAVAEHPLFIRYVGDQLRCDAKKDLLEAVDAGVDRSYFTVSRAITVSTTEKRQSDREHNTAGGNRRKPRRLDPMNKLRNKIREKD